MISLFSWNSLAGKKPKNLGPSDILQESNVPEGTFRKDMFRLERAWRVVGLIGEAIKEGRRFPTHKTNEVLRPCLSMELNAKYVMKTILLRCSGTIETVGGIIGGMIIKKSYVRL